MYCNLPSCNLMVCILMACSQMTSNLIISHIMASLAPSSEYKLSRTPIDGPNKGLKKLVIRFLKPGWNPCSWSTTEVYWSLKRTMFYSASHPSPVLLSGNSLVSEYCCILKPCSVRFRFVSAGTNRRWFWRRCRRLGPECDSDHIGEDSPSRLRFQHLRRHGVSRSSALCPLARKDSSRPRRGT